jgi:hypothetical protein
MAFGIGEALSIGGSIAGGLFGDDANEDAADAIGASNAQIQQMIKDQQGRNDAAYAPYSKTGGLANSRLSQLLGLDIYGNMPSGGYGYNDLVITDGDGNFVRNEALAGIPEYDRAFAQWEQAHQAKYNTNANLAKDSDLYTAKKGVEQYLGNGGINSVNERARMRAEQYKSDPAFGSLLAKFSKGDLDSDVVYNNGLEFGLNEGVKGLNRRAASGGSYDSGATLKALTRYANDYGTTKAEGAYGRFMDNKNTTYGFLSGQQGVGLNATDRNQSLNTGLVGQAVGANQNAASQQAQYGVQGAAALNNGIMGGIGNYLYSQRLGSGGGVVSPATPGFNPTGGGPGINLSPYANNMSWYRSSYGG